MVQLTKYDDEPKLTKLRLPKGFLLRRLNKQRNGLYCEESMCTSSIQDGISTSVAARNSCQLGSPNILGRSSQSARRAATKLA